MREAGLGERRQQRALEVGVEQGRIGVGLEPGASLQAIATQLVIFAGGCSRTGGGEFRGQRGGGGKGERGFEEIATKEGHAGILPIQWGTINRERRFGAFRPSTARIRVGA